MEYEAGLKPSELKKGYWACIDNEFNHCCNTFEEAQKRVEEIYHNADYPMEICIVKLDYEFKEIIGE